MALSSHFFTTAKYIPLFLPVRAFLHLILFIFYAKGETGTMFTLLMWIVPMHEIMHFPMHEKMQKVWVCLCRVVFIILNVGTLSDIHFEWYKSHGHVAHDLVQLADHGVALVDHDQDDVLFGSRLRWVRTAGKLSDVYFICCTCLGLLHYILFTLHTMVL